MALPLSPSERQHAYQLLSVTDQELRDIEKAPFQTADAQLRKLKQRVRKTFKQLVHQYHPDLNPGDQHKARVFSLLIRATEEICARQVGVGGEMKPPLQAPRWKVHTVTIPMPGTFTQVHVRRPQPNQVRPNAREQAARLGKMRP
jgi:hypothetical protein